MNKFVERLCVAGMLLLIVGCGNSADQWKEVAENVKRAEEFQSKKLKGIADDKSVSDKDAYPKYLDALPEVQTNLPKEIGAWWKYKQTNEGWFVTIQDVTLTQWEGTNEEERFQRERDFIRNRFLMCKRMLADLKARNLKQVTLKLFVKQGDADKYPEIFRAVVTQADLPKFENAPAKAEAGGIFDARGPKIGTLATIELNNFPELNYVKRAK